MKKFNFPEDYKGAIVISWDYELQKGADSSLSGKKEWGMNDYIETEKLLKILRKYSVKSVFYCLGYAALGDDLPYHSAKQIKKVSEEGHEVGSHTFNHENVLNLTYEELKETLSTSKEILEEVTNKPVISFASPYNFPFQYLKKLAFTRGGYSRVDIAEVCKALSETGYKTCRIHYTTLGEYIKRNLFRKKRLAHGIEIIHDVYCLRLSCPAGFAESSVDAVNDAIESNKIAVIYAHPHSLRADNQQNVKHLIPFLEYIDKLKRRGELWITTPSEIYYYIKNKGEKFI